MGKVVGQERADRESQEEAHKNEVRMVEELINGRQAQYFHLVSLRRGSIRAGSRRYAHCSWATITGLLNPSRKAEQINRSDKHAPKNARRAGEIQSTRAFQYGAISTIFHRRNDRIGGKYLYFRAFCFVLHRNSALTKSSPFVLCLRGSVWMPIDHAGGPKRLDS